MRLRWTRWKFIRKWSWEGMETEVGKGKSVQCVTPKASSEFMENSGTQVALQSCLNWSKRVRPFAAALGSHWLWLSLGRGRYWDEAPLSSAKTIPEGSWQLSTAPSSSFCSRGNNPSILQVKSGRVTASTKLYCLPCPISFFLSLLISWYALLIKY